MAVRWAWLFGVSAEVVSGRGRKVLLHPTIFCFTVRFVVRIDRQATVWWNRCFAECEVTWRHFRRQCGFGVTNNDGSFLPICCFLSVLLFAVWILCKYFMLCCFFFYSFLLFSAVLSLVFFLLLLLCSLFSLLFFSVRLVRFSFVFTFCYLVSLSFISVFCFLCLCCCFFFVLFFSLLRFLPPAPFRTVCEVMGSRLILVHPVETIFADIIPWHLTMFDEPSHVNEPLCGSRLSVLRMVSHVWQPYLWVCLNVPSQKATFLNYQFLHVTASDFAWKSQLKLLWECIQFRRRCLVQHNKKVWYVNKKIEIDVDSLLVSRISFMGR